MVTDMNSRERGVALQVENEALDSEIEGLRKAIRALSEASTGAACMMICMHSETEVSRNDWDLNRVVKLDQEDPSGGGLVGRGVIRALSAEEVGQPQSWLNVGKSSSYVLRSRDGTRKIGR